MKWVPQHGGGAQWTSSVETNMERWQGVLDMYRQPMKVENPFSSSASDVRSPPILNWHHASWRLSFDDASPKTLAIPDGEIDCAAALWLYLGWSILRIYHLSGNFRLYYKRDRCWLNRQDTALFPGGGPHCGGYPSDSHYIPIPSIHGTIVYLPTWKTIKINHSCRDIYRSSHGWYGV